MKSYVFDLLKAIGLLPSCHLLKIQISQIIFSILYDIIGRVYHSYYVRRGPLKIDNYFVIEVIQGELFLVLQMYLFWRVHKTSKFYNKLMKLKQIQIDTKFEKRILTFIFLIISSKIGKFLITIRLFPEYFIYFMKTAIPEITLIMNDVFFIVLIQSLANNLKLKKSLHSRKKSYNKQVFDIFKIEKMIMERFSKDLFVTISYNYFQSLICFYWTFIRLHFGKFKRLEGKHDDLNYIY
jgi:uncharacterized membrane protein